MHILQCRLNLKLLLRMRNFCAFSFFFIHSQQCEHGLNMVLCTSSGMNLSQIYVWRLKCFLLGFNLLLHSKMSCASCLLLLIRIHPKCEYTLKWFPVHTFMCILPNLHKIILFAAIICINFLTTYSLCQCLPILI